MAGGRLALPAEGGRACWRLTGCCWAAWAGRRLAGLKLLGVALSAGGDSEVWGGRPDALLAETLGLLRSLADIDESAGVRQLASQLHDTLFKER